MMLSLSSIILSTESSYAAEDTEKDSFPVSDIFDAQMRTINNDYEYSYHNNGVFNIAVAGDWGCGDDTKKQLKIFKTRILNWLSQQVI